VEGAILKLDGKSRTMVCFGDTDGRHLCVGGGKDVFIVFVALGGDLFRTLINPAGPSTTNVTLVAGGQQAEYPARQCVPLLLALSAAKTFFAAETADPNLQWE
jgi:hypothetical protein